MLGLQYTGKIFKHCKEWQPKLYKELTADGTLNQKAQEESKRAAAQVAIFMEAGLQAEEYVLPEILLPPEK